MKTMKYSNFKRVAQRVIICCCFHFLAAAQEDPLQGWRAIQNAPSLTLTSVAGAGETTTLTFTNAAAREIKTIAIRIVYDHVNSTVYGSDCFNVETVCYPPGGIYQLVLSNETAQGITSKTVIVDAVVFADGSGEGAPKALTRIKFNRLGQILETQRLCTVFDRPIEEHIGPTGVRRLSQEVGSMPQSAEQAVAALRGVQLEGLSTSQVPLTDHDSLFEFYAGVRNVRERAIDRVGQLRQVANADKSVDTAPQIAFVNRLRTMYQAANLRHRNLLERTTGGIIK